MSSAIDTKLATCSKVQDVLSNVIQRVIKKPGLPTDLKAELVQALIEARDIETMAAIRSAAARNRKR